MSVHDQFFAALRGAHWADGCGWGLGIVIIAIVGLACFQAFEKRRPRT